MTLTQTTGPPVPRQRYPLHLEAADAPAPSRWLWLVKWLLALPHYVVLVFLWTAFVVLSLVALVAILFTGRYPRAIFDFNVGVLRWSWRVTYYAYGALATDQYPPFTLDDVPDYPAHLEVEYPEKLSRGLALVKWWLLAIPHYIVVGIFVGSGTWAVQGSDEDWRWVWGGGLIGILVVVAAIVLAFTGRYPGSLYDLVLGLNRWVLRVAAYAGLMTDRYPPFRLDLGPHEPEAGIVVTSGPPSGPAGAGAAPAAAPPAAPAAPGTPPVSGTVTAGTPPRSRWTAGPVTAVVVGSFVVVTSLALLFGGAAALFADSVLRDDGYVTTEQRFASTDGYAIVVGDVILEGTGPADVPARVAGDVRVRVVPDDPAEPVFVGIARDDDVDAYLSGVGRTIARDGPDRDIGGSAPAQDPADATFWEAQASGPGTQEVVWRPEFGRWAVVVMNADGSPGLAADMDAGVTVPWLDEVGVAALVTGGVLLAGGLLLVVLGVRAASPRATPAA